MPEVAASLLQVQRQAYFDRAMEDTVHRINRPERPSNPPISVKRREAGRENGFALYLTEQLLRGSRFYASWSNVRETYPGSTALINRRVAEPGSLSGAGVINGLYRRERAFAKERTSGIVPSAQGRTANRTSRPGRYSRLDCYEFVAAVLEKNGIRYYGKDGVGRALIEKAKMEHKPSNRFLTGEGLTRLLSSDAFTVNVKGESVQQTWEILEPRLTEGAILSFSSQRAGHTGLVALKDGRWIFINSSGRLGDKSSYRVKEEDLKEEIRSWLVRAKKEKGSLSITLGRVDRELAAAYLKPDPLDVAEMRKERINLRA